MGFNDDLANCNNAPFFWLSISKSESCNMVLLLRVTVYSIESGLRMNGNRW